MSAQSPHFHAGVMATAKLCVFQSAQKQFPRATLQLMVPMLSVQETTLLMQPPIILFAPSMMRKVIPHGIKMLLADGGPATRAFILILLTGLLAMAATFLKSMIPSFA